MPVNPLLIALVSPTAESFEASYGWNPIAALRKKKTPLEKVEEKIPTFQAVDKKKALGMAAVSVAVGTAVVASTAVLVGKKFAPLSTWGECAKVGAVAYAAPATVLTLISLAMMPDKVVVASR